MADIIDMIEERKEELGIQDYGVMNTTDLVISQEVHRMCETNRCGHYGCTWACPPGVGTIEECKERIQRYTNAFVFTTKYDIEDSFDYEGMVEGGKWHDQVSQKIIKLWKNYCHEFLALTHEGCSKCKDCTYPDAPCRFPEDLHPSIEAYGIEAYPLCERAKVKYNNGANTVTYIGCIFY